jgi:hypothetical protein
MTPMSLDWDMPADLPREHGTRSGVLQIGRKSRVPT